MKLDDQLKAAQEDGSLSQYLTFQVHELSLGVEILRVKEIIELGRITIIPMMQSYISGVINLRGSVVPVVDLSARFAQGKTQENRRTCIVILESEIEERKQVVGFMVDAVSAVLDIPPELISQPPQFGAGIRTDFLRGIGKVENDFILLLNVEKLLDFDIQSSLDALPATMQTVSTDQNGVEVSLVTGGDVVATEGVDG